MPSKDIAFTLEWWMNIYDFYTYMRRDSDPLNHLGSTEKRYKRYDEKAKWVRLRIINKYGE